MLKSYWDLDTLTAGVAYDVLASDGPIQSIRFANERYLGNATDVFAYLGIPPAIDRPVPGIVCVHGGGGRAFRQWVELWVARGYAAIAMDLSGRDGAGDRLPNGGPEQDHGAKFSTTLAWQDCWTYHAVAAVMRANSLLGALPEVAPSRIGVTGISWGGYVTCIAAGVDPRWACAIPVYGCGFLQHNSHDDWMSIFSSMTPRQRQVWHDRCDPSIYLPDATKPMLFISGTNDVAYPLDSLDMSCSLPSGPVTRCVRPEMPHGHEAGWEPEEIYIFADQHLRNGDPLPAINSCRLSGRHIMADFTSPYPLRQSTLHYTTGRGKWLTRTWCTTDATATGTIVEAALPDDVSTCFLSIEDDRGVYVSSPVLMLDHEPTMPPKSQREGAVPPVSYP
ncbi:MAG: acetylxylan esterase [Verrucomicrobia bacterium]|nr:acetylxylan esterase [Verrucomicrobiota bacterium]